MPETSENTRNTIDFKLVAWFSLIFGILMFSLSFSKDSFIMSFFLFFAGLALIIMAGFYLLFPKTVKRHCSVTTSALSVSISAAASSGFYSALMHAFSSSSRNPIRYPASALFCLICILVCFLLFISYLNKRVNSWSILGFVFDVLTGIICLPASFFFIALLIN